MQKIVICGGGIAGAACAAVLSTLDYSVTLLEKDSRDDVGSLRRGETLRSEVVKILSKFGFMPYFEHQNALIRMGEVRELWHMDLGKLGIFRYDYLAPEYPVIHASHRGIVGAAYSRLEKAQNLELLLESQAVSIGEFKDGRRKVVFKSRVDGSEHELTADLVIIADGAASRLRNILWIPTEQYDYGTGYLMFYLNNHPSNELKWGRFSLGPEGFVGVFPTGGDMIRAAVEVPVADLKDWLTANPKDLESKLAKRAPVLHGCEIEETGYFYHVIRRHASRYTDNGLCLIGDAAHTTHPMQAQGISMAFNDIQSLRDVLEKNREKVLDDGVLKEFEKLARPFNASVLENNHILFNCFQSIMKDKNSFEKCLPDFSRMGFEATSSSSR